LETCWRELKINDNANKIETDPELLPAWEGEDDGVADEVVIWPVRIPAS
jgi:hypothetical protein